MNSLYNMQNVRRFNADPEALSKIASQKTKNALEIILAGVLIIVSVFLFSAKDDYRNYDASTREMFNYAGIFCIIFAIILLVTCPIILYEASKEEKRLQNVFITLYPDKIEGRHFLSGSSDTVGRLFSVCYCDIISVDYYQPAPMAPSKSIELKTARDTYICPSIEQTATVIKMINEYMVATTQNTGSAKASRLINNVTQSHNSGQRTIYCTQCGTELDDNAAFCYKCGKQREL